MRIDALLLETYTAGSACRAAQVRRLSYGIALPRAHMASGVIRSRGHAASPCVPCTRSVEHLRRVLRCAPVPPCPRLPPGRSVLQRLSPSASPTIGQRSGVLAYPTAVPCLCGMQIAVRRRYPSRCRGLLESRGRNAPGQQFQNQTRVRGDHKCIAPRRRY